MATNDDMNIYNSEYTGKQIDAGLSVIYQEKNGIKSIPPNVFFATNENGEANPISKSTIINTSSLENKLQDYVALGSDQEITGVKTFKSSVVVQNTDGSKELSLSYQSIQIGSSEFTFPQNGGILALKDDIPSLPTDYVTLHDEQTINGLKTFVGGLNIQGNNLNIAPDGNLVFNTSNNKKITFVLPPTLSEDITVALPVSTKDMEDIGKGGSGSTTLQLSTTDYTNTDAIWQESSDNVDVEMGKYYFNITLGSGSTVVNVRTTSNYSLSENSVTALGTNQETWPEIKTDNRVIINPNGTKTVRVYSNAKIAGRTQIAYIQQS